MNVDQLLRLPWTIITEERTDDGRYWVATVAELPGLVATGETPEQLDASLWDALRNHIEERLEYGDHFDIPGGLPQLPVWEEIEVTPHGAPEPDQPTGRLVGPESDRTTVAA